MGAVAVKCDDPCSKRADEAQEGAGQEDFPKISDELPALLKTTDAVDLQAKLAELYQIELPVDLAKNNEEGAEKATLGTEQEVAEGAAAAAQTTATPAVEEGGAGAEGAATAAQTTATPAEEASVEPIANDAAERPVEEASDVPLKTHLTPGASELPGESKPQAEEGATVADSKSSAPPPKKPKAKAKTKARSKAKAAKGDAGEEAPKDAQQGIQGDTVMDIKDKVKFMKKVKLFKTLDASQIEQVAETCTIETYRKGAVIYNQGDEGAELFIIASGTVAVSVDGDKVYELTVGNEFGENALLRDIPRTVTVTAESALTVLKVARQKFQEMDFFEGLKADFQKRKSAVGPIKTAGDAQQATEKVTKQNADKEQRFDSVLGKLVTFSEMTQELLNNKDAQIMHKWGNASQEEIYDHWAELADVALDMTKSKMEFACAWAPPCCAQSHQLIERIGIEKICDICERYGTQWRCGESCNFDVCGKCYTHLEEMADQAKEEQPRCLEKHTIEASQKTPGNRCDLCEITGTAYRCSKGCNYDLCTECFTELQDLGQRMAKAASDEQRKKEIEELEEQQKRMALRANSGMCQKLFGWRKKKVPAITSA